MRIPRKAFSATFGFCLSFQSTFIQSVLLFVQYPCGVNMKYADDGGPLTVNVIFHQRKRFLDARSRAGAPNRSILGQALRDDRRGVHQVRLTG